MPKLFTVEIQGTHSSGHNGRSETYQLLSASAADALIASLRRWSASDRSNDDIRYINLSQNMSEIIEVEGRVDLRDVEFLSETEPTTEAESREPVPDSDGLGF